MNTIDIIIIIVVIIGFVLGFKDGFLRKIIGIIGFIIAVVAVALLSGEVGRFIESNFNIEYYLAEIMAGALIFFSIVLVASILKRVIHPFDKINSLINQIVGGAVGIIQLLLFLSLVFVLLNIFDVPDKKTKDSSMFYYSTYSIIPSAFDYLKEYTPSTDEIIKNYINQKDTLQ